LELGAWNLEFFTWSLRFRILYFLFGAWILEFGILHGI
jgi:hypothetical protein